MPNLLPDWLPWIRPAGRLIWSLLFLGLSLLFVGALIRPPLERKLVTARQALGAIVVVLVVGLIAARLASAVQTVVVWLTIAGVVAISLAAVVSREARSPDRSTTWVEAMLGAVAVFFIFTLIYGIVPHEWLTFANSYLNMSNDRFFKWPPWPLHDVVKLPFSAIRDTVAALIYVVALGGNVVLWMRWQDRLAPRPEPAAAEGGTVVRTSRFGRPVKAKV